jgi:hypothetical protein
MSDDFLNSLKNYALPKALTKLKNLKIPDTYFNTTSPVTAYVSLTESAIEDIAFDPYLTAFRMVQPDRLQMNIIDLGVEVYVQYNITVLIGSLKYEELGHGTILLEGTNTVLGISIEEEEGPQVSLKEFRLNVSHINFTFKGDILA